MIQSFVDFNSEFDEARGKNIDCELDSSIRSAIAFDMMRWLYFSNN